MCIWVYVLDTSMYYLSCLFLTKTERFTAYRYLLKSIKAHSHGCISSNSRRSYIPRVTFFEMLSRTRMKGLKVKLDNQYSEKPSATSQAVTSM